MSLRSNDKVCPIFGSGKDLSKNVLPTYEDLMKYFRFRDLVRDSIEIVSTDIENVWKKASLPIIEHRTIVARIKSYYEKYRVLLKPFKERKNNGQYKSKLEAFKVDSRCLFDIATCKCSLSVICSCTKERKIPIKERDFLNDQRNGRKMMIGSVDINATKSIEANTSRKLKRKLLEKPTEISVALNASCRDKNSDDCYDNSAELLAPSTSSTLSQSMLNKNSFPVLARTLDRYGISDRSGAAIASATLQDLGIVTENNKSNVVDRSKIRRARTIARNSSTTTNFIDFGEQNICVSFDGRKDKTYIFEDNRRKIVVEEHITLLKEPGSKYIGHISVKSCNAKNISNLIFEYLFEKYNSLNNVQAVSCDGTIVNTGYKGGIIRLLEEKIHRPLQWLVCQLHANELLLRHLFEHLDGTTTGPKSFNGPIGKCLRNCENLPILKFLALDCNLPNVTKVRNDLSTDQLYMLDICRALNEGHCDINLSKRNPGKICHSRWLTTANRILRLYISTTSPSANLLILTEFVVKVYAPMWFNIKLKPSCTYGAIHLFETIKLSRYLPKNLKEIIDPVIQRNGYFGHCENILIAMLADDRKDIQHLALKHIIKIRESFKNSTSIRIFKLPVFNFDANEYTNLIDWANISEPPFTKILTDEMLLKSIEENVIDPDILEYRMIPCHTQATERHIKLVTESCLAVCGPEKREGWIQNKIQSMRVMPAFNTKEDYKTK